MLLHFKIKCPLTYTCIFHTLLHIFYYLQGTGNVSGLRPENQLLGIGAYKIFSAEFYFPGS